jgi:hypothetical protein
VLRRVRRIRGAGLCAAVVALACAAASAGAASAPQATIASIRTLHLRVGDQLHVKGAPLACVVQKSSSKINVVCVEGSLSSPTPGAYAVGIADKAADLASVNANSAKVLEVVPEPGVSGAKFAVPSGPTRSYTVAPPAALLVGRTHIFCAVETASATDPINITCGLSTLAAGLRFRAGTYITSESSRFALLLKIGPRGGSNTIAARVQP